MPQLLPNRGGSGVSIDRKDSTQSDEDVQYVGSTILIFCIFN